MKKWQMRCHVNSMNDSFICLAVSHAVNNSPDGIWLDEVSRSVQADSPVTELWVVPDLSRVHDDVVEGDVVVLHELEEGLEAVPCAKVVGRIDVGPQNLFCIAVTS